MSITLVPIFLTVGCLNCTIVQVTPNRVVHSQLVDLRAVFEDSREVPEVPAGELDVPGGQAVADVGGVQGV